MTVLSRRQEALIRALSSRHGRRAEQEYCLAEGLRTAEEAAFLQPDLIELCILREGTAFRYADRFECAVLPEKKFEELVSTVHSQGILLLTRRPALIALDRPMTDSSAIVLDRVADPGNFGTILRTARAAGFHELWTVKGGVDPFCDKALRSGMGAQFAMGIRCAESLDAAAAALVKIGVERFYRTEPAGGVSLFREEKLFTKSAIILGNEANGAAPLSGSMALNIPMPGSAESLNVAQAATVILFEYVRRMENGHV